MPAILCCCPIEKFPSLKLTIRFGVEKQDLYRFLQVRHYYDTKIGRAINDCSPLISIFINGIYTYIQDIKSHSTKYFKEKWEKEMQIYISYAEWLNLWQSQCVTRHNKEMKSIFSNRITLKPWND